MPTAVETETAAPRADGRSDIPTPTSVDPQAVKRAVAALLDALGVAPGSEVAENTPRRVAMAFVEMLTPRPFDATMFETGSGQQDLVLVRDVPFRSVCAHHLLPFVGVAHLGYLPGNRILGVSKFARVIDMFARRLQMQEMLTGQVADWLERELGAGGVAVMLTAEHMCMTARGVHAAGARMTTTAWRGILRQDPAARAEFLSLTWAGGSAR
ncbi:GTP cyclohydrolase I [Plantactinospora sp. CA-290183]|uniref:GTP cyclohydrolase I n=1 Tax=Plantactinospora sp. CA-290183 TaxID=3240006 RepID=UPI003D8EA540